MTLPADYHDDLLLRVPPKKQKIVRAWKRFHEWDRAAKFYV